MGAPITEFVLETVIRDGLGELRATPAKIDDIFGRFLEAQFINQYGQSKIDSIKTYIANNTIKIVHAWQQVPTSMPCISIQLTRSDEAEGIQNLGNEYIEKDDTVAPQIYVPTVNPVSYDTLTGKLVVNPGTDLSAVCGGMVFVDSTNQEFPISSPISNMSGNKFISIGSGKEPSLAAGGKIQSSIDFVRTDRRQIRMRETISLGVHASNDIHLSKFLYYLLVYIMKSRQDSLINRGIELDRGTGSVMDRVNDYEGENIFSRFLEVNCLTEFVWDQSQVQVFDCFELDVKTNEPTPTSPVARKYNTSPTD